MPLDMLITGRIATLAGEAGFGWVEAIGIRDGRVAFAGSEVALETRADPFTERMNGLPKYVASHTLSEARWSPSTILSGDIADQVAELKAQPGGELQLHGSARLSQTLLAAGLIDEIRLVITPTVLGQGRRLFASEGPAVGMRVIENSTTPGGLTILVLEKTADDAEFDTYEGVGSVPDAR